MNKELNIASNFCNSYAKNLSYNDDNAALKHSLNVAFRVLGNCDLKIYKKNDGFVFSTGMGIFGYLTPFEGLLWRFFKVVPKRLFPYSIKTQDNPK